MSIGTFAPFLIEARTRAKYSVRKAAAALGVGVSTLQRWEGGEIPPRADEMLRASEIYGVGVEFLYGRPLNGAPAELIGEALAIAKQLSEISRRLDKVARGGATAAVIGKRKSS